MIRIPDKKLTKEDVNDYLKRVDSGKEFTTREGKSITTIYELYDIIMQMDDSEFSHHVNSDKNDFYNWIEHVIKDGSLAHVLSALKTREDMLVALEERIDNYEDILDTEEAAESGKDAHTKVDKEPAVEIIDDSAAEKWKDVEAITNGTPKNVVEHHEIERPEIPAKTGYSDQEIANMKRKEFVIGIVIGIIIGMLIAKIVFQTTMI